MSGHSKWSTIKRQKEATDAKRGAVFTKLGNQIAIAARAGTDPASNSSLALAIEQAKNSNMPLANIQRAIDRVKDKGSAQLEEVMYEGYGPGGIGVIIECATDNRNRTFPEVRTALTKNGGTVAESGSVSFQFTRRGVIRIKQVGEETLLIVLEVGADDALEEDNETIVYTAPKELAKTRQALLEAGLEIESAELQYVPNNTITITEPEVARKIIKLMDTLDDLDDVSNVFSNFVISEDITIA